MSSQQEQKSSGAKAQTDVVSITSRTAAENESQSQGTLELRRDKVVTDYETRWAVIGAAGAIDFHCNNVPIAIGNIGRVGGIEEHRRTPCDYQRDDAPDHADCRLLGGNCWHDGSSLYASDVLIPIYESQGEDALWLQLEREYRNRFGATDHA